MRNNCLNVWKAVAAFSVLLIHCQFPGVAGEVVKSAARFAVPLFFLISGYYSYGKGTDTVKRRAVRILKLYVLAWALYYGWAALRFFLSQGTLAGAGAELFPGKHPALDILIWSWCQMAPHLWFLGALLYCYVFYGLLVRIRAEEKLYVLIPLLLAANLALGEGRVFLRMEVPVHCIRSFFLTGLPLFLLGHWFGRRRSWGTLNLSVGSCMAMTVLGLVLELLEWRVTGYEEFYFGSILMSAGLFLWAQMQPELGAGGVLSRIGERDSDQIYLWHMLIKNVTMIVVLRTGLYDSAPICGWLMPVWTAAASLVLAEVLYRFQESRRKESSL